jgi:hypothetical protein
MHTSVRLVESKDLLHHYTTIGSARCSFYHAATPRDTFAPQVHR